MDWLSEVLGVKKGHGVELRNLQISELSAVDDPANGISDWLMIKAAEHPDVVLEAIRVEAPVAKTKGGSFDVSSLSPAQLERMRARIEELIRERQAEGVEKRASGWGRFLVKQGGSVSFR